MLPTNPLPLAPEAFAASVGTWLALAAVGALAAMVVGFYAHKREMRRGTSPEIVAGEDASATRDRLSA